MGNYCSRTPVIARQDAQLQQERIRIHISVIGGQNIGKTQLCRNLLHKSFVAIKEQRETNYLDYTQQELDYEGSSYTLRIWEILLTQYQIEKDILRSFLIKSTAIIFCFDITSFKSFEEMKFMMDGSIHHINKKDTILAIFGIKSDLDELREVNQDDAITYASLHGTKYYECSNLFLDKTRPQQLIMDITLASIN